MPYRQNATRFTFAALSMISMAISTAIAFRRSEHAQQADRRTRPRRSRGTSSAGCRSPWSRLDSARLDHGMRSAATGSRSTRSTLSDRVEVPRRRPACGGGGRSPAARRGRHRSERPARPPRDGPGDGSDERGRQQQAGDLEADAYRVISSSPTALAMLLTASRRTAVAVSSAGIGGDRGPQVRFDQSL